jgi:hypothetical protein
MWNPFKKAKNSISSATTCPHTKDNKSDSVVGLKNKVFGVGVKMMQKVAMKKLQNMSPKEQQKIMQEAFKPENKEKLLAVMEQMKASGQISEEQYRMAKQKMGL